MSYNRSLRIALLKQASAAEAVGRGAGDLIKGTLRVGKKAIEVSGTAGKGLAEALGAPGAVGTAAGMGAGAYGLYRGATAGKDLAQSKIDEFRIRHGLYPGVVGY
jgi:hypothetical protein